MISYDLNMNHGYLYGVEPLATLTVMGVHLEIGGAR